MKIGDNILVYGTLRRGEGANPMLRSAAYIGEDSINGEIYTLGGFPGLKRDHMGNKFDDSLPVVHGDVYTLLDEPTISRLDSYEGYPNLYHRSEVETASGLKVWVYTYNGSVRPSQLIESGDWKERIAA